MEEDVTAETSAYETSRDEWKDYDFVSDIPRVVEFVIVPDNQDQSVSNLSPGPRWKCIAVGLIVFGVIAAVIVVIVVVIRTVFHKSSSEPTISWEDLDRRII